MAIIPALIAIVLPAPGNSEDTQNFSVSKTKQIIRQVFGRYGDQAIRVSSCETGGTFDIYARNGQYLGLFQMGTYARSRYGHAWHAWGQARAAYRYFVDSGKDWSPWSCSWAA